MLLLNKINAEQQICSFNPQRCLVIEVIRDIRFLYPKKQKLFISSHLKPNRIFLWTISFSRGVLKLFKKYMSIQTYRVFWVLV